MSHGATVETALPASDTRANLTTGPTATRSGAKPLTPATEEPYLRRALAEAGLDHRTITRRERDGAVVKTTPLSDEFGYAEFQQHYGDASLPMFLLGADGDLTVITAETALEPRNGQKLNSLVDPVDADEVPEA